MRDLDRRALSAVPTRNEQAAQAACKHFARAARVGAALLAVVVLFAPGTPFAAAGADTEVTEFRIPAASLADALSQFGSQSGLQVVYAPELAQGLKSQALSGRFDSAAALGQLLQGTGLSWSYVNGNTIVLKRAAETVRRISQASPGNTTSSSRQSPHSLEEIELEEVVVTGSHIITDPGKLTRQILTITRQELEDSGFTRLDEYLRQLPQNVNAASNVASGVIDSGVNFGRGKNAYAGSGINLRGLGEQYTLVLINGRRPARGGLFGDVSDISTIPVEQVERIEILFDGAAALYGADAIGGVVNIITRRDYEGTQLGFSLSRPEDGGGEEMSFSAGHTFRWGSGSSVTVSGQYLTRNAVDGAERAVPFAPFPADNNGFAQTSDGFTLNPSRSGNIGTGFLRRQEGMVLMWVRDVDGDGRTTNQALDERLSGGVFIGNNEFSGVPMYALREPPPGYVPVHTAQLPQSGAGAELSLYDIAESTATSLPPATAGAAQILEAMRSRFPLGENSYVPGQGYSLAPKDDTGSVSLSFDQEITERLRASVTASFSRSERDSSTRNDVHQTFINSASPGNPFGVNLLFNFSDDLPQTRQLVTVDTLSVSGGLDFDWSDNWNVRLGLGGGESRSESDQYDMLDVEQFGLALSGLEFDERGFATSNGLGFSRPRLGYPDADAYTNALTIASKHTRTKTTSIDADVRLTGVLAQLPAGAARTSVVVSRMLNTIDLYSEQFSDHVFQGANFDPGVSMDARSSRGQTGVGLELSVPLLAAVLANAAARRESYDGHEDSAVNWSAGLNWTTADWMTVRFNRTYNLRLPTSVLEDAGTRVLFAGLTPMVDENREDLPFDPFDPFATLHSTYVILGSNPTVVPEESNGVSLGFIFRPFDGFDVDVNLTDSEILGQLGRPSPNLDYKPSELTADALARNPLLDRVQNGSVTIDGVTYTETSLAADGEPPSPLTNGALVFDQREYNIGDVRSRGMDLNLRYRLASKYGQWFATYGHQYLFDYEVTAHALCSNNACEEGEGLLEIPVDVVREVPAHAGSGFSPVPEHQGRLSLSWESRGLSAHLQTTLASKTSVYTAESKDIISQDGDVQPLMNRYRITTHPATAVHFGVGYDFSGDLFGTPSWMRTTRLNLQIRNLFYSESKLSRAIVEQQFEPGEFRANARFVPYGVDPFGRQYLLELRTSF